MMKLSLPQKQPFFYYLSNRQVFKESVSQLLDYSITCEEYTSSRLLITQISSQIDRRQLILTSTKVFQFHNNTSPFQDYASLIGSISFH
jgi:hypothetical protein